MKRQISKYVLILLIIVCLIMLGFLIYLKFFSSTENKEYSILKSKAEGEMIYLDSTIIQLLNKVNNISYSRYDITIDQINESQQQSDSESTSGGSGVESSGSESEASSSSSSSSSNSSSEATNESEARISKLTQNNSLLNSNYNETNWEEIAFGIENIYTAWPTINLDMKSLNDQEEDINNFSRTLDGVAQAIKSEDKSNTLINLYNLYIILPKFLSYFSNDDATLNLYNTKAYVLSAYISADKGNWSEMNANISQAIKTLSNVMEVSNYENSNLEKSYVLLQDLQKGISLEDKEIFYLKYKLAIEELEIL